MNKFRIVVGSLFLFAGTCLFSQTGIYPVTLISDSLKQNAHSVLRDEITEFTFVSPKHNVFKYKKVVTVLNKNGDSNASFSVQYDKSRSVADIKGSIYDAGGKLIRKIKPSEISDISGSAGHAEFDDIRFKQFRPLISTYPYTVEYEYEVDISDSYNFPTWSAFDGYNTSIEKTCLKVIVPETYTLRYKEFNISKNQTSVVRDGKSKIYTWTAENVKAMDEEPFSDELIRYVPIVLTGPTEFSNGGYEGRMDTWNDYALWRQQLISGRDELSDERIAEIREMVKDISDNRKKVEILYKYLQGRTRYFSVQLGFGGLQPMDAKVVDKAGYSDCKGLNNYMKALLKAIGIESYYTCVEAGRDFPQMIADFPSHQSNHIILCVPLANDTIWLECTSQEIPFGFLGDFTSDRQVLLVKENGGEIVRTPAYSVDENFQFTRAAVTIQADGNGKADITRKFGGLQFDDTQGIMYENPEDQKELLYDYLRLPDFQITSFTFKDDPESNKPESCLKTSIDLSHYSTLSGKRMFLPLNIVNRTSYNPPKIKTRRTDIRVASGYFDADTVVYFLPDGMDIEFLPEKSHFVTPYGEYTSFVEKSDKGLVYTRLVKVYKGTYPSEQYNDFIKFFNDIRVADKGQAILIKKES